MANTFGTLFRVTAFGESHGGVVGCVVDGCPPGLSISVADIQKDLDRRRPGQNEITSPRKEEDKIEILSGIFEGKTTGTPIMMMAKNNDAKPGDYEKLKDLYRPSHADFTYEVKYGIRDWRGGGRASARVTLAYVAAGAIAKKYLKEKLNIEFFAHIEQVGGMEVKTIQEIAKIIEAIKNEGDSVGGVIKGVIKNVPVGLGEPVFDKLSADLAKAMFSINAVKGFEIGSGFSGAKMKGSEHNDSFYSDLPAGRRAKTIRTRTNFSGGIQGGISNGEDILFRVAFKPVATIRKKQESINKDRKTVILEASGRHDPCVLPSALPIVEAMAAITIMDHYLRHKAQNL